jgi:hypothetical protein
MEVIDLKETPVITVFIVTKKLGHFSTINFSVSTLSLSHYGNFKSFCNVCRQTATYFVPYMGEDQQVAKRKR